MITDSRYLASSDISIIAGTLDANPTLVGAAFLSEGGFGGMQRSWSTVLWFESDDTHRKIRISHGCCKTDTLYCTEKIYLIIKAMVEKRAGKK